MTAPRSDALNCNFKTEKGIYCKSRLVKSLKLHRRTIFWDFPSLFRVYEKWKELFVTLLISQSRLLHRVQVTLVQT